MAVLENNRDLQTYDEPIDTVSYVKYDDFFNDEFITQISVKDTNETITENYSAMFDSRGDENNFVYTQCVTACKDEIIKKYYDERKAIYVDYTEINSSLCEDLGINGGYYITKNYSQNDIELHFLKGTSYYEITISKADIYDEKVSQAIREL